MLLGNQSRKISDRIHARADALQHAFDDIFSSAQIGHKKPSKEFFEEIFKRLSTRYKYKKDQILFVDNTAANVEAANDFGFQTHLYIDCEELRAFVHKV